MATGHVGAVVRQIHRLFGAGTVAGLTEGQLLRAFLERRDEAAFEALVCRHGPLVLSVCRGLLDDQHDVEDAFQATFLVLVKKAGSIRDHDLLANWLYGVAHRVAQRARSQRYRRRARELEGVDVADNHDILGRDDWSSALHEEVNRLPEKYRAPIVLCYFQGRTHDEAAVQLRWPVGTVKGRLARARDLLRQRLERRGVAAPMGVLAGTLANDALAAVPPALLESTVKAAMSVAAGKAVAAGLASAAAAALAEGVVHTMFATKLKLVAAGLVTVAVVSGGAAAYTLRQDAAGGSTQAKNRSAVPSTSAPAKAIAPDKPPDPIAKLRQDRLAAAKRSFELERSKFEMGQVSLDQFLVASNHLSEAQLENAQTSAERVRALSNELDAMKEIERLIGQKVKEGFAQEGDLARAIYDRLGIEIELAKAKVAGTTKDESAVAPGDGTLNEDADDELQNQRIRAALNKTLAINFTDEIPLEDVIKFIQAATQTKELPDGIPVYIDPQGLMSAGATESSGIKMNLAGVKLKTTLRLMLKQLGLGYYVKEGLLMVTDLGSDEYLEATNQASPVGVGQTGMSGGMMGGMAGGGGMGGMGMGMQGGLGGGTAPAKGMSGMGQMGYGAARKGSAPGGLGGGIGTGAGGDAAVTQPSEKPATSDRPDAAEKPDPKAKPAPAKSKG